MLDDEKIKTATTALAQSAMKIGEAIYADQQDAAGGDDGGDTDQADAGSDGAENVVDADFEEVDDDSKKSA